MARWTTSYIGPAPRGPRYSLPVAPRYVAGPTELAEREVQVALRAVEVVRDLIRQEQIGTPPKCASSLLRGCPTTAQRLAHRKAIAGRIVTHLPALRAARRALREAEARYLATRNAA